MTDFAYKNVFTVEWTVENYSLSLVDKCYSSAEFKSNSIITRGSLCFIRAGEENTFVWIVLKAAQDCVVDAGLSVLSSDGSVLIKKELRKIHTSKLCEASKLEIKNIFDSGGEGFPPGDMLTIRCRLWKLSKDQRKIVFVRTRFGSERLSFVWAIRNFSAHQLAQINRIKLQKQTKQVNCFEFQSVFDHQGTLIVSLKPFDYRFEMINSTFQVYILDNRSEVIESSKEERVLGFNKQPCQVNEEGLKQILKFPGLKPKIIKSKEIYLKEDTLSLQCTVIINGIPILNYIEDENFPVQILDTTILPPHESKQHSMNVGHQRRVRQGQDLTGSILDDFKTMYEEHMFFDYTLQCESKSFPSHKSVLSVRSPVFRAMFTSGMTESRCDSMEIPDVDTDTMQRFLLFLYTDQLDVTLECDNLCKLYTVADKYRVMPLRERCSVLLKFGLKPENVCDILVFANLHSSDESLNAAAVGFIAENYNKVISSEKWKNFLLENAQLAAKIVTEILLKK